MRQPVGRLQERPRASLAQIRACCLLLKAPSCRLQIFAMECSYKLNTSTISAAGRQHVLSGAAMNGRRQSPAVVITSADPTTKGNKSYGQRLLANYGYESSSSVLAAARSSIASGLIRKLG